MSWYLKALKQYAVFSGRAQRKEYWMFFLFYNIFAFVTSFLDSLLFGVDPFAPEPFWSIFVLAMIIPFIAVGVRRMHDTDHSGWYLLFPFYNFYLTCIDGTPGDNRFGPNPKGGAQPDPQTQTTANPPQASDVGRDTYVQSPAPPTSVAPIPQTQVGASAPQVYDARTDTPAQSSEPGSLDTRVIVNITAAQAAEGCSIQLTTGGGEEVELPIPAGTESGSHLRVPGGGMRQGNQVGDQWVRVNIEG